MKSPGLTGFQSSLSSMVPSSADWRRSSFEIGAFVPTAIVESGSAARIVQLLRREQVFDQQVRRGVAGLLEPDFADRRRAGGGVLETGPERVATPGLFDAVGVQQCGGHDMILD
jgi:hypothetical protein